MLYKNCENKLKWHILFEPRIILLILVITGAILRILSIGGTLTHDELSAIGRLNYDNFSDLIANGVRGDGHPAGVQILMWLWSSLFGTSAISLRIPFVLMGTASIILIYIVASHWYGEWPALLPATIMTASQFMVYYSSIARPYIAGLFMILCMLYYWTRIVLENDHRLSLLLLFSLFAALCAYTHYFCMLSAFILGLAGFIFLRRDQLLRYFGACILAIVLFLPHWGITKYQLFELKGVGNWLGKPTISFLTEFLRYLSHHSILTAIVIIGGYILVFNIANAKRNIKLILVSIGIWLLPYIIGYYYSVMIDPVLQFSSLIFVFPFLLLSFTGGVRSEHIKWYHYSVVFAYGLIMICSLTITRKHYYVTKNEWIEKAVEMAHKANKLYGSENVNCLLNVSLNKLQYYDPNIHCLTLPENDDYITFDSLMASSKTDYLLCGGISDPMLLNIVKHYYPCLFDYQQCVVSEVLLFGRKNSLNQDSDLIDDSKYCRINRTISPFNGEFMNILDTSLSEISNNRFVCIDSRLRFNQQDSLPNSLHLVTEVHIGSKVEWRGICISDFHYCENGVCEMSLPLRMEAFVKHRSQLRSTTIKIYLWNPDKGNINMPIDVRITLYPTNPFLYSVLEEI